MTNSIKDLPRAKFVSHFLEIETEYSICEDALGHRHPTPNLTLIAGT